MARYSIDGQILTDIGDALRARIGETEIRDVPHTSMTYHFDDRYFGSGMYIPIPVCDATQIKITKLATTDFLSSALYTENCDCIETLFPNTTYSEFTLYNFSADTAGFYALGIITFTYDFEATWYDADGNQMEVMIGEEVPNTMTPERMATEINKLPVSLDSSLLYITDNMQYRFYNGAWDKIIELYGNNITTSNITGLDNAFRNSMIEEIPFIINCKVGTNCNMDSMMYGCTKLKEVPMITGAKVTNLSSAFQECRNIRYFPEDFGKDWDWSYHSGATGAYDGGKSGLFTNCFSLRKLPMELFKYGNPNLNYSYHPFRQFQYLYCLDEIVDMPYPHNTACSGTGYSGFFYNFGMFLSRLKNFTFAADIGTKQWAKQTLDLSYCVGYHSSGANYRKDITGYNSGITDETLIVNDDTYQLYKDHPDSWTQMSEYSRYNHDSAVATINSLPDCSEYAAANGSNTIMFNGSAGSKTDGGAINTLTNEEIAVAAAKGWTVTF